MGTETKTVHMADVRQRLVRVVRTSVQEAAAAASQAAPILEDLVQRAELAAEAVAGSRGRGAVRSSREVAGYLVQVRGHSVRLQGHHGSVQASRPALAELGLFLVTWPGPWLFLLLCYVSTSMMRSEPVITPQLLSIL